MRAPLLALACLLAAACGDKSATEKATDIGTLDKTKVEEMAKGGDEAAKAELQKRERAEAKAAFEAALATKDPTKIDELAGSGNGWAIHHLAVDMVKSDVPPIRDSGFTAMEDAAAKGVPEAQLWVGQKMAYGTDGYPWKPNSGMIMVEKAANEGLVEAMFVLAELYAQDQPMQDAEKAKVWYKKAADLGHEGAKSALNRADGQMAPDGMPNQPMGMPDQH